MDNLSSHRHAKVRAYFASENMEAVFTPTYASWLNAIEAHFAPLKKFTLQTSDDQSHRDRRHRIGRYLTWRNRQAGALGSPLAKFARIKLHGH